MKKILFLTFFILISSIAFSQRDDEMENYFGFRSTDLQLIDFGTVSEPQTFDLKLKNTSPNLIEIISVNPPEGIFILLKNKKVQSRDEAHIILMVNPLIYEKEKINGNLVVTVREIKEGVVIDKQYFYHIKAIISNPKK